MRSFFIPAAAVLVAAALPEPGESRAPSSTTAIIATPAATYADLADLALTAPIAAHVRIMKAIPVRREQATGAPAGMVRLFVEAQVVGLIQGAEGLPPRVRYVVDLPRERSGKPPRMRKGSQFILLAALVPDRPGEIRLVAPDAQLPWSPQQADRLRAILREASVVGAAPRISGIGRAFHVPGSLPGESETQIFLQSADGRPVSLSVLRRPGEAPRWAVALSEVVDEAAGAAPPESLLWYRLACTLPPTLPARSLAEADAAAAVAIRADYRLVLERLGPCLRNRVRR